MSLNSDHELSEDLLELEQQLGRLMPIEHFSRAFLPGSSAP